MVKCCLKLIVIGAVFLIPPLVIASEFTGKEVSVIDGDSISVTHEGKAEQIRLNGIDCPEKRQPFGKQAKRVTSSLVFGRDVIVHTKTRDRYGRTIADVSLPDGTNLNREVVQQGWCWWFRKYAPNDAVLRDLEAGARSGG